MPPQDFFTFGQPPRPNKPDDKKTLKHKFQLGDIVKLSSGGPKMTVTRLDPDGNIAIAGWCGAYRGWEGIVVPWNALILFREARPSQRVDEQEDGQAKQ